MVWRVGDGGDGSGIDREAAYDYILSCLTYEGAFGQQKGLEAHGGSTYCAVAALYLMGMIERLNDDVRSRLVLWLLMRQVCCHGCRRHGDRDLVSRVELIRMLIHATHTG